MAESSYVDNHYARILKGQKRWQALTTAVEADVCVIGGGLAGLNTALGLAERGKTVILLEAKRVGWGSSGRNGGSVAKGYSAGEAELSGKIGLARAQKLVAINQDARKIIKKRMAEYGIDCGVVRDGVLSVSWRDNPDTLKRHIDEANRDFNIGYEFCDRARVREQCKTKKYYDGILSPNDFHFNPLDYVVGLAKAAEALGATIYEDSPATGITRKGADWIVRTERGVVQARHVVLCTGVFTGALNRKLSNASFPVLSYVLTTKPIEERVLKSALDTTHAISELLFCSNYYRVVDDNRLLWGGRVGLWAEPKDLAKMLLSDIFKIYPQLKGHVEPDVSWSCQMCYAPHKMPQIGMIEDGFWYNTAYGGHGLCPTTTGGEVIAAAIAEGDSTYREFGAFGLSYAGGKLGSYVAQMVYWWWRAQDFTSLQLIPSWNKK